MEVAKVVRQIEVKNYVTGKKFTMEVTSKQHEKILKTKAETGATININIIKEREL